MTHKSPPDKKILTGTWSYEPDPLYSVECPHCKNTILMSREPLIIRLIKWAILPACPDCHAKATPHNFKYDPATRYYFELIAIKRMTQETKTKYNKRCWDVERKWIENYLQKYVPSIFTN